jgi:hypothetical protein
MTFANPAGAASGAAQTYVRAPPPGARHDATLRRAEAPGKWSAIEVIQHLADTEVVYAWRTRQILTVDRPEIQGYDQDAWARMLGYGAMPLDVTLGQLRGVRTANLRLWRSLTPAELVREGLHSERGPESLGLLIRMMGGHDLVHRRQIDRVLAAAGAPGP